MRPLLPLSVQSSDIPCVHLRLVCTDAVALVFPGFNLVALRSLSDCFNVSDCCMRQPRFNLFPVRFIKHLSWDC